MLIVFQLVGGGKKDLYIGCKKSDCVGYLDPQKATIFELIPQSDGYFVLKTQENYCLATTLFGDGLILIKDTRFSNDCQRPNQSNKWKNDLGQVYNAAKSAIWWNGDNSK